MSTYQRQPVHDFQIGRGQGADHVRAAQTPKVSGADVDLRSALLRRALDPRSASSALRTGTDQDQTSLSRYLLQLQRQYGNRYVQRLIASAAHERDEIAPDIGSTIARKGEGGHLVQQSVAQGKLVRGEPGDRYEQDSGPSQVDTGRGLSEPVSGPSSDSVLRRKTTTWAGEFSTKTYAPITDLNPREGDRYGAEIHLLFTPKRDVVDADKIALVQTAQTLVKSDPSAQKDTKDAGDGIAVEAGPERVPMPDWVRTQNDKDVFKSRMLMDPDGDLGTHIDALPSKRTPLTGMDNPDPGDSSLAGSKASGLGDFGYPTDKDPKNAVAEIADRPATSATKEEEASQTFETAALAVEGVQKGTYYGSVRWGWKKASSEKKATTIPLDVIKDAAPSATFFKAAEKWKGSKDTAGEQSIPLPEFADMFVKTRSDLVDAPGGKGKTIAHLDQNTLVGKLDDATRKGWIKVIVMEVPKSSPKVGTMGWLKADNVSTTKALIKKKK